MLAFVLWAFFLFLDITSLIPSSCPWNIQSGSAASLFQDICHSSLLHCYSESSDVDVCACCEYIHTWPAFDPCLYHTGPLALVLPSCHKEDFSFPCHLLSSTLCPIEKSRWAALTSLEGMWVGWSSEVVGLQVGLCWRPITINGLLPPMRRGHEVTIHHSHIHVSSDPYCSSEATQAD